VNGRLLVDGEGGAVVCELLLATHSGTATTAAAAIVTANMPSQSSGDTHVGLLHRDDGLSLYGDDDSKSRALLSPVEGSPPTTTDGGGGGGPVAEVWGGGEVAVVIRTSCTRWWVLFLYCFVAICQSATWNIFSPISPALALAFPTWGAAYINWLVNTANIAFGIFLFVTPVLINKLGVRVVTIGSIASVLVGAAVRTLPLPDGVPMQAVVVLSMVFNGIGGAYMAVTEGSVCVVHVCMCVCLCVECV
jgi:hypothetical protein